MSDQLIYLIRHPEGEDVLEDSRFGFFKIGLAESPKRRLSALQSGTPYRLELVTTIGPVGDATEVEAAFHDLFVISRHRGEWFKLLPQYVEDLCELEEVSAESVFSLKYEIFPTDYSLHELSLLRELRARSHYKEVKGRL